MKAKHLLILAMPLLVTPFLSASCGDDPDEKSTSEPGPDPVPDPDPISPEIVINTNINPSKNLSPEDQKQYLEDVALTFMKVTPASDFDTYADLVNYCTEEYEDYDWDPVADWAEDAWDALLKKRGTHNETDSQDWYTEVLHITDYDALIAASNFTGHFEARNGSWRYTKASDLQFTFKDETGKECVAKLTTSGGKEVHLGEISEESSYYEVYNFQTGKYDFEGEYDVYNVTIKVPQTIKVELTQAGKTLFTETVNIDLSSLSSNEFVTASTLNISSTTEFSNGYKFNLSQAKYTSGKKAEVAFSVSNSKGTLASVSVSGDIKNLPNYSIEDIVNEDYDDDDFDSTTGDLTYVKVDILDAVHIEGSISNIRNFADNIDEAFEYEENKNEMQKYLNKANKLMNAQIYYGNSGICQAEVTLEAVYADSWNGRTYYDIMPVLNFSDGSRYSTFEAFFNDDDFAATIKAFERLVNKYCDLIDEVDRVY